MDNLTHSLVGVALARTGLDRLTPYAVPLSVIAANVPDIDLLATWTPERYLIWHRNWTHAVLAIPLMALLATALTWMLLPLLRRGRRGVERNTPLPFWRATAVALIPAASHVLLDLTTAYGLRLWLPFSGEWTSWEALFIVEPLVWAILLATVLASRKWKRRARTIALVGLAALTAYGAVRFALRQTVLERVPGTAAFPGPIWPTRWTVYRETGRLQSLTAVDIRWPAGHPLWRVRHEKPRESPTIEFAWATQLGQAYRQFCRYPYVRIKERGEGKEVILGDYRFFAADGPRFFCRIQIDERGRVVREKFEF